MYRVRNWRLIIIKIKNIKKEVRKYEICKYYLNGYESKLIDFYHKNHLDYRGLIPAGAAIDATGKGIYPYVKKEIVEDDSKKFPYPIGSRVKIKIANKDRFATIVGISYNSFGNKQYEIIIDNDNPPIKIHYPTELMTLVE